MGAITVPISAGNTQRQLDTMVDFQSDILTCTPSYAMYLGESREKAGIAEQFILDCELTEDELDTLMRGIEQKYRELEEIDYQDRAHRRGTHLPWNRN